MPRATAKDCIRGCKKVTSGPPGYFTAVPDRRTIGTGAAFKPTSLFLRAVHVKFVCRLHVAGVEYALSSPAARPAEQSDRA